MSKVVCIHDGGYPLITENKVYDIVYATKEDPVTPYRYILDDKGNPHSMMKGYFISIDKWREDQLAKIGIL